MAPAQRGYTVGFRVVVEVGVPKAESGHPAQPPNTLSDAERAQGWRLLFDGKTIQGWHASGSRDPRQFCDVDGDSLRLKGVRAYLITDDSFDNFELRVQWRVAPGGNSGVLYRVADDSDSLHYSAPEMQLIDDEVTEDRQQRAGSLYGLYDVTADVARPTGQSNESRLVVDGNHVEHWLNGTKVVECEIGNADFQRVWQKAFSKTIRSLPRPPAALSRCRHGRERRGFATSRSDRYRQPVRGHAAAVGGRDGQQPEHLQRSEKTGRERELGGLPGIHRQAQ